ncbi:hypothetical protein VN97_g9309 [Penicillium thymicola]|uniref:Uncharacterized protein n=1 Tax=Penicillium thymicola TaxID=293382 RepID=A0AAI9TB57_PENTH|nr:hypothetical protein VN97_g9309 [Penicillium thymicola]
MANNTAQPSCHRTSIQKGRSEKYGVPISPTIIITQNGLRTIPVWKDWYIFTGGNNNCRWLLDYCWQYEPMTELCAGGILSRP